MPNPSVVITGVGLATPLGHDFATLAAKLLAGQSAAQPVVDVHWPRRTACPLRTRMQPPTCRAMEPGS